MGRLVDGGKRILGIRDRVRKELKQNAKDSIERMWANFIGLNH